MLKLRFVALLLVLAAPVSPAHALAPRRAAFAEKKFTSAQVAAGRDAVFPQINGIGYPSMLKALAERGGFEILSSLDEERPFSVIVEQFRERNGRVNAGNLRVALNQFALNGWLQETFAPEEGGARRHPCYRLTQAGGEALKIFGAWAAAGYFDLVHRFVEMADATDIADRLRSTQGDPAFLSLLKEIAEKAGTGWPAPGIADSGRKDLAGVYLSAPVAGAVATALLETDLLTLKRPQLRLGDVAGNRELLAAALVFLETAGWVERTGDSYRLTPAGEYPAKIRGGYLVPYSYLRTFREQEALFFGDPNKLFEREDPKIENHVRRARNILGSKLAHTNYFEELKPILKYLFDTLPLDRQPDGFVDFGCGKGWVLEEALKFIVNFTVRGKNLKTRPLHLAGVDVENVSVRAAAETLKTARQKLGLSEAEVRAVAIEADFNDIASVRARLAGLGFDFSRMVPYFGMVLHNRAYKPPQRFKNVGFEEVPHSTGVFVAGDGSDLNERDVAGNLIEVFGEWSSDFGLISLELYAVATEVAASSPRETLNLSYRHHHALSRQYLVEVEFERRCARLGGYEVQFQRTFPSQEERAQNAMTLYVKSDRLDAGNVVLNGQRKNPAAAPPFPGEASL